MSSDTAAATTTPTGKSEWHKGPDGIDFFTKRWQANQPKAHVVFVHGIIDHVERYNKFFTDLAEQHEITTFAFDQRGWGKTAQKTQTQGITNIKKQLSDVEYFLDRELKLVEDGRKVFLFGHSMGGGIVLAYACRPSASRPSLPKLGGIIASSPMILQPPEVRPAKLLLVTGGWLGKALPSLQMKIEIKGSDLSHDQKVVDDYIKDPLCPPIVTYKGVSDMFTTGESLLKHEYKDFHQGIPLLMHHGTEDKITWFDATKELHEKLKLEDKTFTPYEGYFHECHMEPGEMGAKVVSNGASWILSRA